MKFKLDENFGTRTQHIIQEMGYQIETVRSQNLQGCPDNKLFEICSTENYCLVTLDLDFSDVIRFPPSKSNGVVVVRVPKNPNLALLESLVKNFLKEVKKKPIEKELWIVEIGRVRIHQSKDM